MSKPRPRHAKQAEPPPAIDLLTMDAAGFDALYHERIEPALAAREADRQAGVATYWRRMIIGGAIVVVFVALALANSKFPAALVFGIAGYFGVTWLANWPLSNLYGDVKEQALDAIAEAIDCRYLISGFDTPEIARLQALGLLPNFDRDSYEDGFHGERLKREFYLYEATLEERHGAGKSERWVTVFDGQIVRVAFPKKFLGTTVVGRDKGLFNFVDRFGTKLQRVGLEDAKFERDFEVYASDQVEARELVHPVFMERLLALETHFDGSNIRCAFQDGDLLLAVEGPNRFEFGSMFAPLADADRVRAVVNDICEILRLMDTMLTAETAPLVALGNKDYPTGL